MTEAATTVPPTPVTIDIVSDVVCPWCYIGKRRLEAALAQRPEAQVVVRWHPFQLDPTIPEGGLDRTDYMMRKFGGAARIEEIHARLTEAGRQEGIPFAFEKITRAANTLDAHRLLKWADAAGLQDAAAEALFRAYFIEGRDIGDRSVLAGIADEIGLEAETVREALDSTRDVDAIQSEIETAQRIGVTGVPFFIFAQAFAVSGAQASAVLANAIDKAREAADASAMLA